MEFRVPAFGFRVRASAFDFLVSGFAFGFRVSGSGFRVSDVVFRVSYFGFLAGGPSGGTRDRPPHPPTLRPHLTCTCVWG